MIEVNKILSDKFEFDSIQLFQLREDVTTRGNSLKLYKKTKVDYKELFVYIQNSGYMELTTRQCHISKNCESI